jgi:hypothetical protein
MDWAVTRSVVDNETERTVDVVFNVRDFLLRCQSAAYKSWPCQQAYVETRGWSWLTTPQEAVPCDNGGCASPKKQGRIILCPVIPLNVLF